MLGKGVVHVVVRYRKVADLRKVADDDKLEGTIAGIGDERLGVGDTVERAEIGGIGVPFKTISAAWSELYCVLGSVE